MRSNSNFHSFVATEQGYWKVTSSEKRAVVTVEGNASFSAESLSVYSLCNCRELQQLLSHTILCIANWSNESNLSIITIIVRISAW